MSIRVTTTTTGPDPGELNNRLEAMWRNTTGELFNRFQAALDAQAWSWPRTTKRRVGTAGSPRNIIDRGQLKQSGLVSYPSAFAMEATWSIHYATAVHEGARLRNGTILPARPWTDAVLGRVAVNGIPVFNIGQMLQDRISKALGD